MRSLLLPLFVLFALGVPGVAQAVPQAREQPGAEEPDEPGTEEAEEGEEPDEPDGLTLEYASRWRTGRTMQGIVYGYQAVSLVAAVVTVFHAANFRDGNEFFVARTGLAWAGIGFGVMSLSAFKLMFEDGRRGRTDRAMAAALLRGAAFCGLYAVAAVLAVALGHERSLVLATIHVAMAGGSLAAGIAHLALADAKEPGGFSISISPGALVVQF